LSRRLIHGYNTQEKTIYVTRLTLIIYRSSRQEEEFLVAFMIFTQRTLTIMGYENHPNLLRLSTEIVQFLKGRQNFCEISRLARLNDWLHLASRKYINHKDLIQFDVIAIVENDESTNALLQVAVISTISNVLAAQFSSRTLPSAGFVDQSECK